MAEVFIYHQMIPDSQSIEDLIGKTLKNDLTIRGIVKTNYNIYDRLKTTEEDFDPFIYEFMIERQKRYFQLYMTRETLDQYYSKKRFSFTFFDQDERITIAGIQESRDYEDLFIDTSRLPNENDEIVLSVSKLDQLNDFKLTNASIELFYF